MNPIDIEILPRQTDILSGEAMPLNVKVSNNGTEPVSIQTSPVWPISYELNPTDGNTNAFQFSRMNLPWLNNPDAPQPEVTTVKIDPGKSELFSEDPAYYGSGGTRPGLYQVLAVCKIGDDIIKSKPITIEVARPNIKHFHRYFCTYKASFVSLVETPGPDGKNHLYQRETDTTLAPYGVFRQIIPVDSTDDIGVTVHTSAGVSGRWISWTESNSVHAVLTWEGSKIGEPLVLPSDLTNIKLVQPGFLMKPQEGERFARALFMVVGLKGKQTHIQCFIATQETLTKGESVPLCQELPEQILAGYAKEDSGNKIYLTWEEKSDSGTSLYYRCYTGEGQPVSEAPVKILEKKCPLLAMEIAPILPGQDFCVNTLFGPVKTEEFEDSNGIIKKVDFISYCRIPLSTDGVETEEYILPAPDGASETPVDHWAISGYSSDNFHIIAKYKDAILHAPAKNFMCWKKLFPCVDEIDFLHCAATWDSKYWCAQWTDPVHGIMYMPNPDFVMR